MEEDFIASQGPQRTVALEKKQKFKNRDLRENVILYFNQHDRKAIKFQVTKFIAIEHLRRVNFLLLFVCLFVLIT
jgi:hypothetical protein